MENNQQPPMVLRVNLSKTSRENYLQLLAGQDIAAEAVSFCPSAIRLDKPVPVDLLPGFADGLVSVQDTAAQLAAGLLDVQPGHRVLDVCAAPGGKTAHILESQPQLKELVAVDIDEVQNAAGQRKFAALEFASQAGSWRCGKSVKLVGRQAVRPDFTGRAVFSFRRYPPSSRY